MFYNMPSPSLPPNTAMSRRCHNITELPTEILEIIMNWSSGIKPGLLGPNDRKSLSVESFGTVTNDPPIYLGGIQSMTLVCRKFRDIGLQRLFERQSVRFSLDGFQRLQDIANHDRIPSFVRNLSYMLYPFYHQIDKELFEELLRQYSTNEDDSVGRERLERDRNLIIKIKKKADEQRRIIGQEIDRHELFHALTNFSNLQQIRLMRNYDADDRAWQARFSIFEGEFAPGTDFAPMDWALACQYATGVLSDAIKQSNSGVSRFSSRLMELPATMALSQSLRSNISQFVVRLQSLEIQFIDRNNNLDAEMLELAPLLHTVFEAATGLQCVHIGFAMYVSIPLVTVFGNAPLKRVTHIGLHGWRNLDKDEIIELLDRPTGLRSLRLRHLSLVTGKWMDILQHIRLNYKGVNKWVSLRGVTYPQVSSQHMGGLHFTGAPNPHAQNSDEVDFEDSDIDEDSTSDTEESHTDHDDEYTESASESASNVSEEEQANLADLGSSHADDDSEQSSDDDDATEDSESSRHIYQGGHHNEEAEDSGNESEMEPLQNVAMEDDTKKETTSTFENPDSVRLPPRSANTVLGCQCIEGYTWEDLEDNGVTVDASQWRKWQDWVVKRCPIHDRAASNVPS